MAPLYHPDANAILARLKQEQITELYHFTCVDNLPLICQQQALYSKAKLDSLGLLDKVRKGGDELSQDLDQYNKNRDKVSLSFTPYLPMAYHRKREQHLCFLVISPEVAAWSGVVFTDTNAAATRRPARRGEGLTGLGHVNFEAIRARIPRPSDKEGWFIPVQAETLVPDEIPLQYISQVAFVSKASKEYADWLCDPYQHPEFVVNERLFMDLNRASHDNNLAVVFPHVREITLRHTHTNGDQNMVYLSHSQKNIYSRKVTTSITLVADIQATIGTLVKFLLYNADEFRASDLIVDFPSSIQTLYQKRIFNQTNLYRIENTLVLESLLDGSYLAAISLDNVLRGAIVFTLQP